MSTVRMIRDPLSGGVHLRFTYDPLLVGIVRMIDRADRSYDPDLKRWWISSRAVPSLRELLAINGHELADSQRDYDHVPAPRVSTWADALFAAVGPARVDDVTRALSKVLHPDRDTGDTVLMQQLTDARRRVTE